MGGLESDEENKLIAFFQTLNELFSLEEKFKAIKQYSCDHPIITISVMVTIAMCSIPVFCFMLFMIGSSFMSFTAFLLIEGTVLTLGTLLLGGALLCISMLSLSFTLFLVCAYYSFRATRHFIAQIPPPPCMRVPKCDSTTK